MTYFDPKKRAAELGLLSDFNDPHKRRTALLREKLQPSPPSDHEWQNLTYGWNPERLAIVAGVSVPTAKKWLNDPPPLLVALLRVAFGDLAGVGPEWKGFRVSGHGLHHPEWRWPFTADELRGLYAKTQAAGALSKQLGNAEELLSMYRAIFGPASVKFDPIHPEALTSLV